MAETVTGTGTKPLTVDVKPVQEKVEVKPDFDATANLDTGNSLDSLLEAQQKAKEEAPPAPEPAPAAPEPPAPAAPPAPEPKKGDSPSELYPDIQLPQGVKGKSAEQWSALKDRFSTDLTKLQEERNALQAKLQEAEAKLKDPVPADLKKEVEDLRAFRARLDVEADPAFSRQFDGKIDQARQFIYSQLKATGKFNDGHLKQIKDLGGPENVDWDSLFTQIGDATTQRLIQARLDEIAVTKFDKQRAVEAAKADVGKYLQERQESYTKAADAHHTATRNELTPLLGQFKWLEDPPAPKPSATPDEITVRDAAVKFNAEVKECINEAMRDDSPGMRAILVAGMAQLLKLRQDHSYLTGAYKKATDQLREATDKLANYKKASVSRLRESSAPADDKLAATKIDYNTHAIDALDALRREQQMSRGNA